MPGPLGGAPPCPTCGERVYFSDEKPYMSRKWHKKCFKCCECSKVLESTTANLQEDESLLCNTCQRKRDKPAEPAEPREAYVNHDDPECCPRCGTRVYFAEQMLSLGRKWHKRCFTCAVCQKKMESAQAFDHKGEMYCRGCYGRNFGPKGYGFAGGAGTGLSMETGVEGEISTENIPHTAQAYLAPTLANKENDGGEENNGRVPGGEYCARCNMQVFIAEKKQAAGNVYHVTCFTCKTCQKKLDASLLTEKQNDIFCKKCYGRNYGPKGYGYGTGAGILQMN